MKRSIGQEILAKAPGLLIGLGIPTAWHALGLSSFSLIPWEALTVFLIFIGMVWVLTLVIRPTERTNNKLTMIDWIVNIMFWAFGFLATFFIKM